jgi:hypothetical protein
MKKLIAAIWYKCPKETSISFIQLVFCFQSVVNANFAINIENSTIKIRACSGVVSILSEGMDSLRIGIPRHGADLRPTGIAPAYFGNFTSYRSKKESISIAIVAISFVICYIYCMNILGMYSGEADKFILNINKVWRNS